MKKFLFRLWEKQWNNNVSKELQLELCDALIYIFNSSWDIWFKRYKWEFVMRKRIVVLRNNFLLSSL